jgi:RimJ/RimL family protein N-acetyltransferase
VPGRRSRIHLVPWGPGDLELLERLLGDAAMTEHLGGPEAHEQLVKRQERYEAMAGGERGRMFKIVDDATGHGVGSVGYWDKTWRDQEVYETGWSVLPAFQGRGIATEATAQAIARARVDGAHRYMHAFPSVDNGPSNAICRKLGFTLLGAHDFEYPPGHPLRCNDWRLDLVSEGAPGTREAE